MLHEQLTRKGREMESIDQSVSREYDYATAFSRYGTAKKAREVTETIIKLSGVDEEVAVKMTDLKPSDLEQLRSIMISYKLNLPEDILNKLLDYLNSV